MLISISQSVSYGLNLYLLLPAIVKEEDVNMGLCSWSICCPVGKVNFIIGSYEGSYDGSCGPS